MSTITELQAEIAAWADEVVPHRTAISLISKLLEEIGELLGSEKMGDPSELADVMILCLDLAYVQKIDIEDAIRKKIEVNRKRKWKVADNGAARHVKD
jgi:NTP pyrophosphatase (non-canonical NTP hydrolase)